MGSGGLVLQLASLGEEFDAELAARYALLDDRSAAPGREPDWSAFGADALGRVEVAVTSVRRGFPAAWLDRLPALRAVCSWGVGFDTLDVTAAAARGVRVSNTPDVLDDCVADLAWALLLGTARRTAVADRYVKQGRWTALGEFPLATRVSGKKLGILGMGRIGEAVARRGAGFAMTVRYCNRRPRPELAHGHEPSLAALAAWCDFLVVACPGGPETRHLVDADVLRRLGPRGILVNIARGSVVDQDALLAALRSGELGGAGLDVLATEPARAAEFAAMDQALLTPHVGSATTETRAAMSRLVVDNVHACFEQGAVLTPVAAR